MIFLLSWLVKLSYVFQFLHQKNEKRPPLLRMAYLDRHAVLSRNQTLFAQRNQDRVDSGGDFRTRGSVAKVGNCTGLINRGCAVECQLVSGCTGELNAIGGVAIEQVVGALG
jgi:hypothetical protein